MKLTIRTKLLIGFTLLLVLSSLIQAFSFSITREYISSQISEFQLLEAKKGAGEIESFFTDLNATNLGLARVYRDSILMASGSASKNDLSFITQYTIKNNEHVRKIAYLTLQGRELMKYDLHGQVSQDQLNYELFTDSFKTAAAGKTAISKVYYLEKELGPHIDIFTPVFETNDKVAAVIKMQVNLEQLRKRIENIKSQDDGHIYIVDEEGRLIAHHSQQYVFERPNLSSRALIKATLTSSTPSPDAFSYNNENNVAVTAKAVKIPGINWVAVFEQPTSKAYDFLVFIRNFFLITLIGSSLFLLLIALMLSENLTQAIRKLQQSVQAIEHGELNTPILIKSGDEIEALSHSFASMVNQLLQRENSLRKEKHENEILLQSLTDAVVGLDSNYNLIVFNKAAEKLTGLSATNVIGKNVDEILHFYQQQELVPFAVYSLQEEELIRKLKEKGLNMSNDKGEKTTVSITTAPILFQAQQVGSIITFHDITQVQELEEMKLDFVSMAAHELRTPLTAIRGYASLLEMENAKELDDSGKQLIRRLVMSSESLGNLIDNLLSVARIERNIFGVEARPVDLTNTIKNVVDGLKQQANTQNKKLTLVLPHELPVVLADAFRVGQVLLNLIANALNYTKEGASITVTAEKKDNLLQVSVTDTGQGIPKEAISKLFVKFFRVSGSLKQGSKGTGLGLFISKSIIEMHHGKIWVESELGKGTTFTFVLPIAKPEDISNFQQNATETDLTVKSQPGIIVRKS